MTSEVRRRLNALSAALAPCLGCLDEEIEDAELDTRLPELRDRISEAIRAHAAQVARGEALEPEVAEDERRETRRELQDATASAVAALRRLELQRRGLLRSVPRSRLRTSCENCVHRKRTREQVTATAGRVFRNIQARKEEEWDSLK